MLEQSFYEPDYIPNETEPHSSEPGLFDDYEIRSWQLSPRIYKILATSAVLNIVALLVVAQTSLLTMKGCDSPLVGGVCKVLDTVYVGAMLFGTDREYADAEYEKTELADADVTFVDVSGEVPPLSYPEGYFQIANPEEFAALQAQADNPDGFLAPGIPAYPSTVPVTPPMRSGGLLDTRPKLPKSNPNAIDGDLPSGIDDATTARTPPMNNGRTGRNNSGGNSNAAANSDGSIPGIPNSVGKDPNVAQNNDGQNNGEKDEATQDQFGVYINKRPLRDKADETLQQLESTQLKLDKSFKVIISATLGLGKDGKTMVLKDPRPLPVDPNTPNDPALVKLAQDWIIAVGDSGWFGYLNRMDDEKKPKPKKVVITVEQNDADFFVNVRAEQPTENDAKTASSGLNGLLGFVAPQKTGDEQVFLQSASTTSDGKFLILNFHMPKAQVQEMIQRKLAEEKSKEPKPNGNAGIRLNDVRAIR